MWDDGSGRRGKMALSPKRGLLGRIPRSIHAGNNTARRPGVQLDSCRWDSKLHENTKVVKILTLRVRGRSIRDFAQVDVSVGSNVSLHTGSDTKG